jgi:hypothetical protein
LGDLSPNIHPDDQLAIYRVMQQDILNEIGQRMAGRPSDVSPSKRGASHINQVGQDDELKYEEYDENSPSVLNINRQKSLKLSIAAPADADNGLSYSLMKSAMDARHPRYIKNGEPLPHSYCDTRTGWHCCCRKNRKSDI